MNLNIYIQSPNTFTPANANYYHHSTQFKTSIQIDPLINFSPFTIQTKLYPSEWHCSSQLLNPLTEKSSEVRKSDSNLLQISIWSLLVNHKQTVADGAYHTPPYVRFWGWNHNAKLGFRGESLKRTTVS